MATWLGWILALLIIPLLYAEEIVTLAEHQCKIEGNVAFNEQLWQERQAKIKAIVDAEIQHKRNLEIEVAKFNSALALEYAGSSQITITNTTLARNTNTITSTQEDNSTNTAS
jgi:uncharacterized protein (DUF2344 family)